jgi:type I restriction enzyme M protein
MSSAASNLVNKVWNYCNLLRDDGVSYGDYVEQLTYLLFLKMDYERTRPPYNRKSGIPEDYNWASLMEMDGLPLERHYRNTLENLGKEPGILGIIFRKAQNKIQNPAHLRRLIFDLIDKEPWNALGAAGLAPRPPRHAASQFAKLSAPAIYCCYEVQSNPGT